MLACLDEMTDVVVPELSSNDMVELAEIGAGIIVLLDWDARRHALVQNMLAAGIQVKVIIAIRPVQHCRSMCRLPRSFWRKIS